MEVKLEKQRHRKQDWAKVYTTKVVFSEPASLIFTLTFLLPPSLWQTDVFFSICFTAQVENLLIIFIPIAPSVFIFFL